MRKIISILLSLVLMLSFSVTVFAAETTDKETRQIDVYARYVRDIAGEYTAPAEDGKATVTLPDEITVITMTSPSTNGTLISCSLGMDSTSKMLNANHSDGKITFTTDDSNIWLCIVILLVSFSGMMTLIFADKKK